MNAVDTMKKFLDSTPDEGEDGVSGEEDAITDEEILTEGKEQKEPKQVEKDDEKLDELMMLQEWDDEKNPLKYGSVEEKYEEQLLLDHVEKMVAKYLERDRQP